MKTSVLTLVASAALMLLGNPARADQLADIKSKGVFVCGTLGTAEPFSFPNTQTREVEGYDADFCRALAKSLGAKLELKLISVAARIPELQQGRVDVVIASLGWTAERAEQIAFSDQYFVSEQKMAVRKDSGYKALRDLSGKRVSALKGSSSEMLVRKAVPGATTITFQDPPSAFLAMLQGKVDAFAIGELYLEKYRLQSESTVPIVKLEPSLASEPWGIGMRRSEPGLIKHVNAVLQAMEKSGEAQQIFDKWLGSQTIYKMKRSFKIEPIKG